MKGVVFVLFEKMVEETAGPALLERLYVRAGIPEDLLPFVGPATYDDRWMGALVGALSEETGTPPVELERAFGRYLFPELARRHPMFLVGVHDARTFLVSVDAVIHVEVHKLDPSTVLPMVRVCPEGEDRATLIYRSQRRMCALLEGLLEGVATWFDQDIQSEHHLCTHRGDADCRFRLVFGAARRQVA